MILTPAARTCIILGACALLGGGVLLHSSRWGLGLSPDSVVYIGAARSLLAGHGFTLPAESALFSPITHYPPLYSSLLAVTGSVAADPLNGAIWLNVAAFSVNILRQRIFALCVAWFLAVSLAGFAFHLHRIPAGAGAYNGVVGSVVHNAGASRHIAVAAISSKAGKRNLLIGRARFTRSVWNRSLIFPRRWQVGSLFGL